MHAPEAELARELGKTLVKNAGTLLFSFGKKVKSDAALNKALFAYASRFHERHGQIKVLGMARPVRLLDVFTTVELANAEFLKSLSTPEELQSSYVSAGCRSLSLPHRDSTVDATSLEVAVDDGSNRPLMSVATLIQRGLLPARIMAKIRQALASGWHPARGPELHGDPEALQAREVESDPLLGKGMTGVEAANAIRFLNVLGQPGTGKTTLLKRIGLEALLPKSRDLSAEAVVAFEARYGVSPTSYAHKGIPVLIELRRLRDQELDLLALIVEELANIGIPENSGFAHEGLHRGQFLLLLDGIDEVPEDRIAATIQHVRDFADKYKTNRFITSCRTAFYRSYLSKFTDVALCEFNDQQISEFITRWFVSRDAAADVPDRLFAALFSGDHASTLELARTPLLLTLICLYFERSAKLPANRSRLYERAFRILLEEWSAEKLVHLEQVHEVLHPDREELLLAAMAGRAFEAQRFFFRRDELAAMVSQFFEETLDTPGELNGGVVVERIAEKQGLLVERAHNVYSFSHLTIQEFLTALYFRTRQREEDLVRHFGETRWREVFFLYAGMLDATRLIVEMAKVSGRALDKLPPAEPLLRWIDRVTHGTKDPGESAARRAIALCVAGALAGSGREAFWQEPTPGGLTSLETVAWALAPELWLGRGRILFDPITVATARDQVDTWLEYGLFESEDGGVTDRLEHLLSEWDAVFRQGQAHSLRRATVTERLWDALGFDSIVAEAVLTVGADVGRYVDQWEWICRCREGALRVGRREWERACTGFLRFNAES